MFFRGAEFKDGQVFELKELCEMFLGMKGMYVYVSRMDSEKAYDKIE